MIVTNIQQCRKLWRLVREHGSTRYGTTDNFDFRLAFTQSLGMHPWFIVDSSFSHPEIILPLSRSFTGSIFWFGGPKMEDNYPMVNCNDSHKLAHVLSHYGISELLSINKTDINIEFKNIKYTPTGYKIKVTNAVGMNDFIGNSMWNQRNLNRVKRHFETNYVKWNFCQVNEKFLSDLFFDSIALYTSRKKTSSFGDVNLQKRYKSIFLSPPLGINTFGIRLDINGNKVATVFGVYADNVATVSSVTINVNFQDAKSKNYIFRFIIINLPKIMNNEFGAEHIDYQGGAHEWKKLVNPKIGFAQYKMINSL